MNYTAEDVRDRLWTLDKLVSTLEPTENLNVIPLSGEEFTFNLPEAWNVGLKDAPSTHLTDATINVDGQEYRLAKDAILEMSSTVGLNRAYVEKTPGELVQPHLNYWASVGAFKTNLLTAGDTAIASVKESIDPFSNVRLLEAASAAIREKYGDVEILADYKSHHELRNTNMRLIVPDYVKTIKSDRSDSGNDVWSVGIDINNSLLGKSPLSLRGYLFAWWCTNGATITHASSGHYNRRTMGQGEGVYQWAETVTLNSLDDLDHELETIAGLTEMQLEGEIVETMTDIFNEFKVPAEAQDHILDALVESGDTSAYGVLAAVTQAANVEGLSQNLVSRILEIGGSLPHALAKRCEACHKI